MIKKKVTKYLLSVAIVIFSLIFAGFISNLLALHSQPSQAKVSDNLETEMTAQTKPYVTPSPIPQAVSSAPTSPAPTANTQPTYNTPVASPTPKLTPAIQTDQVNVSINGSSSFTVSVNDGLNQCDVLNKALAEGKISSLNIRYDQNFGTYAIYQINGVGKENSVWWTYTVNGQSPNQGCSFIKAKNNDNVEWSYIGS